MQGWRIRLISGFGGFEVLLCVSLEFGVLVLRAQSGKCIGGGQDLGFTTLTCKNLLTFVGSL